MRQLSLNSDIPPAIVRDHQRTILEKFLAQPTTDRTMFELIIHHSRDSYSLKIVRKKLLFSVFIFASNLKR